MIIFLIQSVFARTYRVVCLAILCGSVLVFTAMIGFFPATRPYLVGEDQIIENLSALFFFASFVFALVLLRQHTVRRRLLIFVAVLALAAFLDEVSFGGRIIGVEFPIYFGTPFDGIHDVVAISFEWTRIQVGYLIFPILFIVICGAGTLIFLLCRNHLSQPGRFSEYLDEYFFGGLFCIFLSAALFIDLHIVKWGPAELFEELFEMNAGLVLLLYCAGMWKPRNLEPHSPAE